MILYRSLKFKRLPDESLFKSLERLAAEGLLKNNRKLIVKFKRPRSSRFVEVICSMKNLEKLHFFYYELTLEILAHVFQSCSKITELRITDTEDEPLKMPEHLKNQLRSSFQRLRYFHFQCIILNKSWPVIQEMLT